MIPIDVELVRRLFNYNPETGVVTRAINSSHQKAGAVVGNGKRHLSCSVKNKRILLHRIIWAIHYGEDPGEFEVDHINGDSLDNRIDNLRRVTHGQNMQNMQARGFRKERNTNSWSASIMHMGKRIHIGSYPCPLLARLAYEDKAIELRGCFARG